MGFTQSVFIRKNTPELIEKLLSLRYKLGNYRPDAPVVSACCGEINSFFDKEPYPDGINCGKNEDLFLALAALRDDSDYMQWFVIHTETLYYKEGDLILCREQKCSLTNLHGHKATVKELIEYSKEGLNESNNIVRTNTKRSFFQRYNKK